MPGLINLDFADVRTVMQDGGNALMGIGFATGENRAREAAERALRSPLIDTELAGARGILLSIAGGDDLSLFEVNEAAEVVRQGAVDDTNLIFGATIDERLNGQIWVTVVATGLGGERRRAGRSPSTRATRRDDARAAGFLRISRRSPRRLAGAMTTSSGPSGRPLEPRPHRSGAAAVVAPFAHEGRDRSRPPADRRGRRADARRRRERGRRLRRRRASPPGWPRAR